MAISMRKLTPGQNQRLCPRGGGPADRSRKSPSRHSGTSRGSYLGSAKLCSGLFIAFSSPAWRAISSPGSQESIAGRCGGSLAKVCQSSDISDAYSTAWRRLSSARLSESMILVINPNLGSRSRFRSEQALLYGYYVVESHRE